MDTTAFPDTELSIDVCNRLLRGEFAAFETYGQAIAKFEGEALVDALRRIQSEHESNADLLRYEVEARGGSPDDSSGAWGAFAKAVQGTANFLGEESAIASLTQGEEWGQMEYSEILDDDSLDPALAGMIRKRLLPQSVQHIRILNALSDKL